MKKNKINVPIHFKNCIFTVTLNYVSSNRVSTIEKVIKPFIRKVLVN